MITKQTHSTVYVLDQDRAKTFYTEKLGYEVRDDARMGDFRKKLVESGKFGGGVLECDDIHRTYEELKGRGVEFTSPPTQMPYGIEALFKDDSGNFFSLGQKK